MVLSDPNEIDAAWIDAALQRAGMVQPGAVVAIEVQPAGDRAWSHITRVRVHYREGLPEALPRNLLIKMCVAEGGVFGRSEVDYYRRDYVGAPDATRTKCFDAAYADAPRWYHLLLEDLSETHVNGDEVTPDEGFGRAFADSLAALHAHRWGAERLQQLGLDMPGREDVDRYVAHVVPGLEPMLVRLGPDLAPHWTPRLRAMFAGLAESFAARAMNPRGMTLVHGDLNPGNLLVPRAEPGPVLFIDRQPFDWSLTRWLATSDLVSAIVPWWDTPVRRRLESSVLLQYHAALRARGVTDYPLSTLQADYRLCIAMAIAVAVEWCVLDSDRE